MLPASPLDQMTVEEKLQLMEILGRTCLRRRKKRSPPLGTPRFLQSVKD